MGSKRTRLKVESNSVYLFLSPICTVVRLCEVHDRSFTLRKYKTCQWSSQIQKNACKQLKDYKRSRRSTFSYFTSEKNNFNTGITNMFSNIWSFPTYSRVYQPTYATLSKFIVSGFQKMEDSQSV